MDKNKLILKNVRKGTAVLAAVGSVATFGVASTESMGSNLGNDTVKPQPVLTRGEVKLLKLGSEHAGGTV